MLLPCKGTAKAPCAPTGKNDPDTMVGLIFIPQITSRSDVNAAPSHCCCLINSQCSTESRKGISLQKKKVQKKQCKMHKSKKGWGRTLMKGRSWCEDSVPGCIQEGVMLGTPTCNPKAEIKIFNPAVVLHHLSAHFLLSSLSS